MVARRGINQQVFTTINIIFTFVALESFNLNPKEYLNDQFTQEKNKERVYINKLFFSLQYYFIFAFCFMKIDD